MNLLYSSSIYVLKALYANKVIIIIIMFKRSGKKMSHFKKPLNIGDWYIDKAD